MSIADAWIARLKNNKFIAVFIVIAAVLTGLAQLTDAVSRLKSFIGESDIDITNSIWRACFGPPTSGYDGCSALVTAKNGIIYLLDTIPGGFIWRKANRFYCEIEEGKKLCVIEAEDGKGVTKKAEMTPHGRWAYDSRKLNMMFYDKEKPVGSANLTLNSGSNLSFSGNGVRMNDQETHLITMELIKKGRN